MQDSCHIRACNLRAKGVPAKLIPFMPYHSPNLTQVWTGGARGRKFFGQQKVCQKNLFSLSFFLFKNFFFNSQNFNSGTFLAPLQDLDRSRKIFHPRTGPVQTYFCVVVWWGVSSNQTWAKILYLGAKILYQDLRINSIIQILVQNIVPDQTKILYLGEMVKFYPSPNPLILLD